MLIGAALTVNGKLLAKSTLYCLRFLLLGWTLILGMLATLASFFKNSPMCSPTELSCWNLALCRSVWILSLFSLSYISASC
jgi:hypothetical protein